MWILTYDVRKYVFIIDWLMIKDSIYGRFRKQVVSDKNRPAILEAGKKVSYEELDNLVDRVLLKIQSYGKFSTIGIVMSHGTEMIASMLAVLKSGAAYVPAEPSLPAERRDYMMETAGVRLVIDDNFVKDLPPSPDSSLPDCSSPDTPAYVLYTSGTTGRPKGVKVLNRSVVNYAEAFEREFQTGPGDVMLQFSVCSFDIFVEEVFTTLLNGAALAIPPVEAMNDIKTLMGFVKRKGVTIISGFPYLLAEMNKLDSIPVSLRLLISGGDVLREGYVDRLIRSGVAVYNTYGPSETTVCASYFRCDNAMALPDGTYPIGKPVKGVEILILDSHMNKVPRGETGEICILGEGVSDGYVGGRNIPEQKNFSRLPDGRRLYRSGDLGYLLPDGNIAFLRRKDDQVMILGKRVEPEEVANVLNSSPEVERGVVCPFTDSRGLSYLVAYFVPKSVKFSLSKIREWLAGKLTDFMIPEYFVAMKTIPLTRRGKVDKEALPVVLKEGEAV